MIFVFESNLAGRHCNGDALLAINRHGAVEGQPAELQGGSYAIPVRDEAMEPLSLSDIKESIKIFIGFARNRPDDTFLVTKVGLTNGFYDEEVIKPLFENASINCYMPEGWGQSVSEWVSVDDYLPYNNQEVKTVAMTCQGVEFSEKIFAKGMEEKMTHWMPK